MKHSIQEELKGIVTFIGLIWAGYFLSLLTSGVFNFNLNSLGVTPRTFVGFFGIPVMPFLHASFAHLLGNTVPLLVLLTLLAGSNARSWMVVFDIILVSGFFLWIIGRSSPHVGASGLVFGLMSFMLASGFFEKRLVAVVVSLVVGFVYGGTLLFGMLPQIGSNISWEGHLCGIVSGVLVAYIFAKFQPRAERSTSNLAE